MENSLIYSKIVFIGTLLMVANIMKMIFQCEYQLLFQ